MGMKNNCGCGSFHKPTCKKINFEDVVYENNPELSCLDPKGEIEDLLDFALKVEAKICEAFGDYSLYDVKCLVDEYGYITTEQEFVEAISDKVCNNSQEIEQLQIDLTNIDLSDVWNAINNINNPQLTLTNLGILPTNSLVEILQSINTIIGDINNFNNIEAIDWNAIFNVVGDVEDLNSAFTLIINKIEELENGGTGSVTLPTFNTTNTCLPNPSESESLSSVITKIIAEVCSTVKINLQEINKGCIAVTGNSFQNYFQSIFDNLNNLIKSRYVFDDDYFDVQPIGDECDGLSVTLKPNILGGDNNKVAVASGTEPGFLLEVLEEGDNISLDLNGDAIKISGTFDNDKVKATPTDSTSGTLIDKIEGVEGINVQPNTGGGKIILSLDTGAIGGGDGKVLASSTDDTPSFLAEKLQGSSGITVSTTPDGKMVTLSSNYAAPDGKVKIDQLGDFQYLSEALLSENGNLTITNSNQKLRFNVYNDKVKLNSVGESKFLTDLLDTKNTLPTSGMRVIKIIEGGKLFHSIETNYQTISNTVINTINGNPALLEVFCTMVNACIEDDGERADPFQKDYNHNISGVRDGVNTTFSGTFDFRQGSMRVYKNGLRLSMGGVYDFEENEKDSGICDAVIFNTPPLPEDNIIFEYLPVT